MYKRLYYSGIVAYVIMFVLAILFYKERTILSDLAYNLFQIVLNGSLTIQHFRYGDTLTQFLPLLGVKAGWSLDTVLMLYSSGFVLLYFVCYVIAGAVLKQYQFALTILMVHILFASETFYYILSPLIEGITLLLLAFAGAAKMDKQHTKFSEFIIVVAFVLLAFFHPLLIFPVVFCIVFFLRWQRPNGISSKTLWLSGITFFTALVFKTLFIRAPYEQHALGGLKNFITLFPDYFSLYSHGQFLLHCLTQYYWIPVVFVAISIHYYTVKEWQKLGFFLISFMGYLFLVDISYPNKTTPAFYIENLYMPLSVFLAVPFIFDVLPILLSRKIAIPVMGAILLTGCARLYTTHQRFTNRLDWERSFLKQHGNRKMIYAANRVPADTLQMIWGTPYEFWLLSTIEQGNTASIIIDDTPGKRMWASGLNKTFLVNWNKYDYRQLDPRYFHFADTVSTYLIIE